SSWRVNLRTTHSSRRDIRPSHWAAANSRSMSAVTTGGSGDGGMDDGRIGVIRTARGEIVDGIDDSGGSSSLMLPATIAAPDYRFGGAEASPGAPQNSCP